VSCSAESRQREYRPTPSGSDTGRLSNATFTSLCPPSRGSLGIHCANTNRFADLWVDMKAILHF
jgi:hypothetical protein